MNKYIYIISTSIIFWISLILYSWSDCSNLKLNTVSNISCSKSSGHISSISSSIILFSSDSEKSSSESKSLSDSELDSSLSSLSSSLSLFFF